MIKVEGTASDIITVIQKIAPDYPCELLRHLDPGESCFIFEGIEVYVYLKEEK